MYRNSKQQGDMGVGAAIAYFTKMGWTVSIPLTDSQPYDLVVDAGEGVLQKVQVKTTLFKRNEKYEVCLKTSGGNKTGTGKEKSLDLSAIDYLFIATGEDQYLIPASEVDSVSTMILGPKYSGWAVTGETSGL